MSHKESQPIKDDNGLVNIKNLGGLDWSRLENRKSNDKRVPSRFLKTPNGSPLNKTSKQRRPPRVRWPSGSPVGSRVPRCPIEHMVELVDGLKEEQVEVDGHVVADVVSHSCPWVDKHAEVEFSNETPGVRLFEENNMDYSKKHDLDVCEQPVFSGKQPSPSRGFSFNLGKMARSFSLKESPTVAVNAQESPDSFNHSWKKSNGTSPSRSSPLRRFLEPFLKTKETDNVAAKVHKPKLEPVPSNVQALLKMTLKNGIPFFKLAVESSSDILAAAVRKLPSGKDDTSLVYAFYSVHEAKKKSGSWIYQSSKEKGYNFEYNIVGQMSISSSYHVEFSGPEKGLYVVRESVLYNCQEGELAATIVKNLSDESFGDIGSSNTTIVVLPDTVHLWPNSGSPSPLLNRWKCGGSCDCEGWDIGCQFHVISSHQNEMFKTSNNLDLCYQVGYKNKCSFSLVTVEDGLYSLEYDPSMSMLQAFSICVAVVSSQKLTHMFEVNCALESKDLSKAIPTDEKVKIRVSKPAASPYARV